MAPKKLPPSPKSLLSEAKGVEEKISVNLYDYADVIGELRAKNLSYGKISLWLAERLNVTVNRGLVYRIHEEWYDDQVRKAEEASEDSRHDEPPDQGPSLLGGELDKLISFVDENFSDENTSAHKLVLLTLVTAHYQRLLDDEAKAKALDEETEAPAP